jgi:hypothetical protein
MSSIGSRDEDESSEGHFAYAPKWARGTPAGQPGEAAGRPANLLPQAWLATPGRDAPVEDEAAARTRRVRRSLQPVPLPEPPEEEANGSTLGLWIAVAMAVAAAAVVAFVVVSMFSSTSPDRRPSSKDREQTANSSPMGPFAGLPSRAQQPPAQPTMPAWVTAATTAAPPAPAASPPTATAPIPPAVAASSVAAAAPDAPTGADRPAAPASRLLDPQEVAELTQRGETLLRTGNVAAARLVLQWPAEASDPRAALALGGTFDPSVLKQLRVVGSTPDLAQARAWYERAAALGSAEASRRLRLLPR